MADASLELPEGIAPVISFNVTNTASDFNAVEEVEAPEDAMIVDPMAAQ
jgi:hypothetical protein